MAYPRAFSVFGRGSASVGSGSSALNYSESNPGEPAQSDIGANSTRPNTPPRGILGLSRYLGQPPNVVYGGDSLNQDSFQAEQTAGQQWQATVRQPTEADPVPAGIRRWPGPASQLGTQWDPKMGGNANLLSHGFWASWNTLRLGVAYIPMARQQQKRSVRTHTTRYRAFETLGIPGVFVPTAMANFKGGFGKP